MKIKTLNEDFEINETTYESVINSIYNRLSNNINNKDSIILISNNNIINNDNFSEYIDNDIYLYIDKHKNIKNKENMIYDLLNNILQLDLDINIENYDDNLNTLIEMGYDSNIAINALQENENDLFNSINYLLDI